MTDQIMTTATMLRDRAAGLRQRAKAAEIKSHVAPGRFAAFAARFEQPPEHAPSLLAQADTLEAAALGLERGRDILAITRAQLDVIGRAA